MLVYLWSNLTHTYPTREHIVVETGVWEAFVTGRNKVKPQMKIEDTVQMQRPGTGYHNAILSTMGCRLCQNSSFLVMFMNNASFAKHWSIFTKHRSTFTKHWSICTRKGHPSIFTKHRSICTRKGHPSIFTKHRSICTRKGHPSIFTKHRLICTRKGHPSIFTKHRSIFTKHRLIFRKHDKKQSMFTNIYLTSSVLALAQLVNMLCPTTCAYAPWPWQHVKRY